jgi:phosphoglycolate phosphatase
MPASCRNIIFDLDGTLTNPIEGIFNSVKYALKQMNWPNIPVELSTEFIGPPLQNGFKAMFGMNDKETEMAVKLFRDYYGTRGLYENKPYEGIGELLSELTIQGKRIFVATSKLEKYAWEIIRHFEFDRYIEDIQGADYNGNHSKSDLIEAIIDKYRLAKKDTLMVGDTLFDMEGAHETGIKCLGVGYGFSSMDKLAAAFPDFSAETVNELGELLID